MKNLAILLTLLTCGCACKNDDIPEVRVTKPIDKYLNCNNLKRELVIAKFEIRASIHRLEALPAYAKNLTCMPATQLQIEKAQNMAENRVDYIKTLMREKGCEIPPEPKEVVEIIEVREPISIIPLPELGPNAAPVLLKNHQLPRPHAAQSAKHKAHKTLVLKKKHGKPKKPCA